MRGSADTEEGGIYNTIKDGFFGICVVMTAICCALVLMDSDDVGSAGMTNMPTPTSMPG